MFTFFKKEFLNELWYIHSMRCHTTAERNKMKMDVLIRKECHGKGTGKFKYRTTWIAFSICAENIYCVFGNIIEGHPRNR